MITLSIGRTTTQHPDIAAAVRAHDHARDESGDGARDWPSCHLTLPGGVQYEISYNGRVWQSVYGTPERREIVVPFDDTIVPNVVAAVLSGAWTETSRPEPIFRCTADWAEGAETMLPLSHFAAMLGGKEANADDTWTLNVLRTVAVGCAVQSHEPFNGIETFTRVV